MRKLMSSIYQWILKILGIKKGEEDVPQGLQCFDASGNLTLDVTDRLTRVLGTFTTPNIIPQGDVVWDGQWCSCEHKGSITDPNLLTGTPWFVYTANQSPARDVYDNIIGLDIRVVGSTLYWSTYGETYMWLRTPPNPIVAYTSFNIVYGVF